MSSDDQRHNTADVISQNKHNNQQRLTTHCITEMNKSVNSFPSLFGFKDEHCTFNVFYTQNETHFVLEYIACKQAL